MGKTWENMGKYRKSDDNPEKKYGFDQISARYLRFTPCPPLHSRLFRGLSLTLKALCTRTLSPKMASPNLLRTFGADQSRAHHCHCPGRPSLIPERLTACPGSHPVPASPPSSSCVCGCPRSTPSKLRKRSAQLS